MTGSRFKLALYQRYKPTYPPEQWQAVRHEVYKNRKAMLEVFRGAFG